MPETVTYRNQVGDEIAISKVANAFLTFTLTWDDLEFEDRIPRQKLKAVCTSLQSLVKVKEVREQHEKELNELLSFLTKQNGDVHIS